MLARALCATEKLLLLDEPMAGLDTLAQKELYEAIDRLKNEGMTVMMISHEIDRALSRIFVTLKELLGTWEENAAEFLQGETVEGIVRTVEDYGIFIELAPNLAGLAEPRDDVEAGQKVSVYIKSIIPGRMKVKLVLIELLDKCTSPVVAPYFIDCEETGHMDAWRYSPAGAPKLIMTDFTL